jgi:hypothetical protein
MIGNRYSKNEKKSKNKENQWPVDVSS